MPDAHYTDQKHSPVLIGVGGFLIGVVLTSAWFLESRLPRAGEDAAASAPATSTETGASSIVSVHDQHAGSTVAVDAVAVPAPGVWVAVEELRDGQLANVLGATRTLGPAMNVSIELLRPTLPGSTYAIVLYRDNGDGVFNHLTDSVYVDFTTGERVVALFDTTL